jgi:Alpha-glucosidases, family 31 of glycosyl hydrolases
LGAFYPFSRGHAAIDTKNKEPWAFGPEIEQVSRLALNRRYRLLPYLYTLFQEASSTGLPVMRPVFFADTKDTTLRREDQAFLLGQDLMVVPKWAVNPVLPTGNWRLISIAGEDSRSDKYQPDVLIREGAIVPLGKLIQSTAEYRTDSLTLIVSPDAKGEARGVLYEDAGEGYGYRKGLYSITQYTATTDGRKVVVKCKQTAGLLKQKPKVVKIVLMKKDSSIQNDWQNGKKWVVSIDKK